MPRDLTGCGRYPPRPRFEPLAFYSAVRNGDPEMLAKIMQSDPYFLTQDNGAGAPLHFAVTYRQLDMALHLLNCGACVNQRDGKGLTPLHRAAALAHVEGYLEIAELLLSRGADPSLRSEDLDPYLEVGRVTAIEMTDPDSAERRALSALCDKYAFVKKMPVPHPDVGDWWALYDYGPSTVAAWPYDFDPEYPEERLRREAEKAHKEIRDRRRQLKDAYLDEIEKGGDGTVTLKSVYTPVLPSSSATSSSPATSSSSATSSSLTSSERPKAVLLFPGQGSQALGMLAAAAAAGLPRVDLMLRRANEILGYDILEICTRGPKEKLDDTSYSQPALYVANLAALELFLHQHPSGSKRVLESRGGMGVDTEGKAADAEQNGERKEREEKDEKEIWWDVSDVASVAAGLSLGEYCALAAAGAISFEQGLQIVKVRGAAMARAACSGSRPHGMASIVGLDDAVLSRLCEESISSINASSSSSSTPPTTPTVCQVANYLFPQGRTVSGHLDALAKLCEAAAAAGAVKAAALAVSGAFHTPLMAEARKELETALKKSEIRPLRIPVISNVTAQTFPKSGGSIVELLSRQLTEPVQWETSLRAAIQLSRGGQGSGGENKNGTTNGNNGSVANNMKGSSNAAEATATALASTMVPELVELGPGAQIKAMVRRLDNAVWKAFKNIAP